MDETLAQNNVVCDPCLEANLTSSIITQRCANCKVIYCVHTASTYDPVYCIDCLKDTTISIKPVHNPKATIISYAGASWLFVSRKIKNLSDDELELAIEYHYAILKSMLAERDERRQQAYRKAVIKIANFIPMAAGVPAPKVKKAKKAVSGDLAKIIQDLLKTGMSKEDIMNLAKPI